MKYVILAVMLLSTISVFSQDEKDTIPPPPSQAEMKELVNKFAQDVVAYDKVVKLSKPVMSDAVYQKDEYAITLANTLITKLNETNNMSAGQMVLFLSIIDDLTLDSAQTAAVVETEYIEHLSQSKSDTPAIFLEWNQLLNESSSFYDLSDLVLHATIRYVDAEEYVLVKLLK